MRADRPFYRVCAASPVGASGGLMTIAPPADKALHSKQMLCELYELIAALDRRLPQLTRNGELQIAHGAAELRERALSLIQTIEGTTPME
jgi:hypothetical protein